MMENGIFQTNNDNHGMPNGLNSGWTCPNDRELMLRAKLESGWSCKSSQYQSLKPKPETITEVERKIIADVLLRAKMREEQEKRRISKMIERLRNMKRNACGDGHYTCILCNETFWFFQWNSHQCQGCCKLVCNKCVVDTITENNETLWFCKICSETKEILKKSGPLCQEVKRQLESLYV